jgi:predicted nucleic acid-binding protein
VIHLDSGFLIRALVPGGREDRTLRAWLRHGEAVRVSAITWSECRCGPLSPGSDRFARAVLGEPVAFTAEDAMRAADFFRRAGRRRGTLADCMIAAVAVRCGARLATTNAAAFAPLESAGLVLAPIEGRSAPPPRR